MLALEELVKNSCCLKEFVSRFLLVLLLSEFCALPYVLTWGLLVIHSQSQQSHGSLKHSTGMEESKP